MPNNAEKAKKNALIISGGGSKGAFAVGVIEYLVRVLKLDFDIVGGTSTGALIAPFVVTGDIDLLAHIYTSLETDDVIRRRRTARILTSSSVYTTEPVEQLIEETITLERARTVLKSKKRMFLATVCLQTKDSVYFHTGPRPIRRRGFNFIRIESRHDLMLAMLASGNQPVLMPPVRIPSGGDPIRQYVDGGVREIAPLRVAVDNKATDIYAIVLSPETKAPTEQPFRSTLVILPRTISIFTEEVVDNDIEVAVAVNEGVLFVQKLSTILTKQHGLKPKQVDAALQAAGNPFQDHRLVNLHVVRPKKELPLDGQEFDPDIMAEMKQMGKKRAEELLGPGS